MGKCYLYCKTKYIGDYNYSLSVLIVGGSLWIVLYFFHTHILFASYILAVLFVLLTMLIGILLKKASKTF